MPACARRATFRRALWLACVLLMLVPRWSRAAGTFRTVEEDGLRIVVDAEWGMKLGPGYLPVRLDITNLADARTITLTEQSMLFTSYRRGPRPAPALVGVSGVPRRRVFERTIHLARGARVQLTMPVLVSADNENMQLIIGLGGVESGIDVSFAATLIVVNSATPYGQQAPGWSRPIPSGVPYAAPTAPGGKLPQLDVVLDPPRLPTAWMGYSALRAVIIGPAEWQQLTAEQRAALRKWTACGGDLIVVDGDPDERLAAGIPLASSDGSPSTVPYLLGHLHRTTSSVVTGKGLDNLLINLPAVRNASWRLPANRSGDWKTAPEQGFRLRMAGIGQVHAQGYLTLLLLFAVLIGPVNYLYLRRRGLQPLLVLTAPLIAVVFLVLLGSYVIAGEGFSVHARAATLTVLDQERQEAVTRGAVSMYAAGRTPGSGLRFSSETAVFPFEASDRDEIHVDLNDGQRFDSGLVRARTPSNFETLEWRVARERLTFARDGSTLKVTNGLGVTIQRLRVRSGDQDYALTTSLPPGGQAALRASALKPVLQIPVYHTMYARFQEVEDGQPPNSYLALVDRAPSWQPGLANAVEQDSVHVMLGLTEHLP
jgi:hypothetical protein